MTRRDAASKPPPGDWIEQGNCRGMDINLFFPEEHAPIKQIAYDACNTCPVRIECLNYSLASPKERWGLWGGLGSRARDEYLKAKRAGQERLDLGGAA